MRTNDPRAGRRTVRGKRSTTVKQTDDYSLDDAFELFYNVKQAERMRDRTLSDYRTHWRYFRAWIDEAHPGITLREVTKEIIRQYVIYMSSKRTKYSGIENREVKDAKLSPTTVAIRLRTLRTMFGFWASERMIDENPAQDIQPPKEDDDEIEAFTDEQLRLLLAQPDPRTFAGFRDKTLMLLLADGGYRINEALQLREEHIVVKSRYINLPASMNKNRKPRIVPVSLEVMRALFELINENKTYFDTDYIFVTNYGEPLRADVVRHRLRRYGKMAGISEQVRVSPHTFRHYFCKTYLLNGGDIFTLQRIVGHENISTTRKYVQMDDENIRQQHAQFSPITRLGMSRVNNRRK